MITRNAAKCLICGDTVESKHRHDFKYCSCENISVDGGYDYFRYGFKDSSKMIVLSEVDGETYDRL